MLDLKLTMTTITEHEVIIEGLTLDKWHMMTDDELVQTKSYQWIFALNDKDNAESIEKLSKKLESSDWPEYNSEREWESKSNLRRQLDLQEQKDVSDYSLNEVRSEIRNLSRMLPNGIAIIDSETKVSERGWALMKELGLSYCDFEYNGGHDSGGIEGATVIDDKGHTLVENEYNYEEIFREGRPTFKGKEADAILNAENRSELPISLNMLFRETGHHWNKSHKFSILNPLTDPIDEKFGTWAGSWSAQGNLIWDLRKEIKNSKRATSYSNLDWIQISEEFELGAMMPNPDYKKTPVLHYTITEYVGYSASIDEPDNEIRGESYSMD